MAITRSELASQAAAIANALARQSVKQRERPAPEALIDRFNELLDLVPEVASEVDRRLIPKRLEIDPLQLIRRGEVVTLHALALGLAEALADPGQN